ncbi:ribonuclease HI family protein [Candidatus Saccharibacteria bacterium]|jgi:ribonuclease HI|nr:ribonuclease HI family protein [Candidatus Saccharibacteria bacterium]
MSETSSIPKKVIINCDGGSRGNPGPSASGFVIQDPKDMEVVADGGKFLGITTNNQAEYRAVLHALEMAKDLGIEEIEFRLDSLLVVNQMKGIYKVKNKDLWVVYEQIKKLATEFKNVTYNHVLREYNKLADAKANQLMDENR